MKKVIVVLLFIVGTSDLNAQDLLTLGIKSPWYFGFIETNEHKKYMGHVQYNSKTATVHFKSATDSTDSKVFTEDRIFSMEFYDTLLNKERKFYSLEYKEQPATSGEFILFEILKEFENFAMVSREAPISIEKSQRGVATKTTLVAAQFEWLFFVGTNGIFKAVFVQRERETGGTMPASSKNRNWIFKDVLEEYTGKYWPQLEAYVESHELKLKNREHLLKVMDYYETLLNN